MGIRRRGRLPSYDARLPGILIDKELREEVERFAEEHRITLADVQRIALESFIKRMHARAAKLRASKRETETPAPSH